MDGLAFGSSSLPVRWQWLEEATALPSRASRRHRVYGGKRLNSQDGTLQLISTTRIANPGHLQPYFWQIEKSRHAEANFQVH